MKLIVSHGSALEYWRYVSTFRLPRPEPARIRTPGDRPSDAEILPLCARHALNPPLHLLVPKSERRPHTDNVVYHAREELLPCGSLAFVEEGLFVASPELCFLQQAAEASFPEIVDLAYELCGTYTPSFACTDRSFGQDPETSIPKLEAFMGRAKGMRGVNQAKRALRYALPNSASPAETVLSMLLTLPYLSGGCSLSQPQLNYRIDPGKHARKNASQDYYKCDLFWEKTKLAVEYDSNLCHTGGNRISRDSKRRDELAGLNVTVVTVTTSQLFNFQEFNKVARTVAKLLGERIQPRNESFPTRQLELRSVLLAKLIQHPNPLAG